MLWLLYLFQIKKELGLNPGSFFQQWITKELQRNNIHTMKRPQGSSNEAFNGS